MTLWVPYMVVNDPDFDPTFHKRLEDFILRKPSLERYHANIRLLRERRDDEKAKDAA